jgi:uncharacterized protein
VDVELVDHHCHTVIRGPLDRRGVESFLTESDRPPPPACTNFDTQLGAALRRLCAPLLDLPSGAAPDQYVARRRELGADEVNRRLLGGARVSAMLVDTGLGAETMLDLRDLGRLSGAAVHEVVRLEAVADHVAAGRPDASQFADAFAADLNGRLAGAVAVKSVIAYRDGLDFDPRRPSAAQVRRAADEWLARGAGRLEHPILLRHLLWQGLDSGLPLQLHTGFGDPDEDLRRCDPALLTGFLRAADAPVMLLHCYPYHRHAAYLASVFPHVHMDVGLAIPHVGHRASAILAETLELCPFHKLLYSSDAYGLPELHFLAAATFREALGEALAPLRIDRAEARRIADLIAAGNARRVYGEVLGGGDAG